MKKLACPAEVAVASCWEDDSARGGGGSGGGGDDMRLKEHASLPAMRHPAPLVRAPPATFEQQEGQESTARRFRADCCP